jgi:hypothetical protein
VVGAVALLVLVGGCGSSRTPNASEVTSPTPPPDVSASKSPPPSKAPTQTSETKAPEDDPLAPPTIQPVMRDGKRPHPHIQATPASFHEPVTYSDGVQLRVLRIKKGQVTGSGPGVIEGPTNTFVVSMRNRSDRPVDLNRVVVTALYGSPARIARPVYTDASEDFTGRLRPGKSTMAAYSFAIPTTHVQNVKVIVDFDADYVVAQFHGPVS